MRNKLVHVAIVTLGMAMADIPPLWAAALMPAMAQTATDVLPVAKKRKKVASSGPVLLGRVEDIDRRERGAKNRRGGKVVGRVPTKGHTQGDDAFGRFMQGFAMGTVQTLAGVGGASGGCGIDVTTPNPTGCGTRMGGNGGNGGLRPPYYCLINGRKFISNTFRAGCWMVSQENTVIPMGR